MSSQHDQPFAQRHIHVDRLSPAPPQSHPERIPGRPNDELDKGLLTKYASPVIHPVE